MPKYPARGAASGLGDAAVEALKNSSALPFELLGRRVENAIGGFTLPAGMATNMIVDGRDVLIPMATEKSSVIAAAGNTARQCRGTGGFFTSDQRHGEDRPDPDGEALRPLGGGAKVQEEKTEIGEVARRMNETHPRRQDFGEAILAEIRAKKSLAFPTAALPDTACNFRRVAACRCRR